MVSKSLSTSYLHMKTNFQTLKIEFLDYLENEKGFSKHTIESYALDLKVFFGFCNDYDSCLELNLNKI